jgi:ribosomal protein S18 acetylase RimI-like enzyme
MREKRSMDEIVLAEPSSGNQLRDYFTFRWQHLRAPWDQPPGSERDEFEAAAHHLVARTPSGELVGIGRIHFPNAETGQIRYMATKPGFRGRGIGSAIANELERIAKAHGVRVVVLNARASAVSFYEQLGYVVSGNAQTLFGEIEHKRMQKTL